MPDSKRTFELPFTDVPGAIAEIRAGRMVVVVDDEDRENEGDLTLAAEHVTPMIASPIAGFVFGVLLMFCCLSQCIASRRNLFIRYLENCKFSARPGWPIATAQMMHRKRWASLL